MPQLPKPANQEKPVEPEIEIDDANLKRIFAEVIGTLPNDDFKEFITSEEALAVLSNKLKEKIRLARLVDENWRATEKSVRTLAKKIL